MATAEQRSSQRLFLDAAAQGDLVAVKAWLAADGDVNMTMGEGWTALLYAVANSRVNIVRRLVQERAVDLNATTVTGSSALTLALGRKNNSLAALLLKCGASRATLSQELWQELELACWLREDVRLMLSPQWSLVWRPSLHCHFPPSEREKCRLVAQANVLALRQQNAAGIDGGWVTALVQWVGAALAGQPTAPDKHVRWRYLPPQLVHLIIEFAVYLW